MSVRSRTALGSEEREKLMYSANVHQAHACTTASGSAERIGICRQLFNDLWTFCDLILRVCDDLGLLTDNHIFNQRKASSRLAVPGPIMTPDAPAQTSIKA
jgi:hypothetical protein